jgi:aspartyl-tRNA(Asn)/glutamyl-tRNA(Gln) amidotransferase subunit C
VIHANRNLCNLCNLWVDSVGLICGPMRITDKDVAYVADLAHLDLTPEERARFGTQLDSILSYAEQLNELDTSNVPPMAQVLTAQHENETLREDVVRPSLPVEAALANAAERGAGYFKVPKVIER